MADSRGDLKNLFTQTAMRHIGEVNSKGKYRKNFKEIAEFCLADKETFGFFKPLNMPEAPARYNKLQDVKGELSREELSRYNSIPEIREYVELKQKTRNANRAKYLWLLKMFWLFHNENMPSCQEAVENRLLTFSRNDMNIWGSEKDRQREEAFIKHIGVNI